MIGTPWWPAYVGIGSNLGDSRAQIERAYLELDRLPTTRVIRRSPIYRSVPFGPVSQGDFHNAVAALITQLSIETLWQRLRQLESELGRAMGRERWGPREIDLDLLVHGQGALASDTLTVPHPGISERDFVLYPLRDVAPALWIPEVGRVESLAARVVDRGMQRLE